MDEDEYLRQAVVRAAQSLVHLRRLAVMMRGDPPENDAETSAAAIDVLCAWVR